MIEGSSGNLIKNVNQALVLAEILKDIPTTKRALAERTALSFPTVSKIIDDMETKKQIIQRGLAASSNGRKAAMYALNPAYAHILCIYFQYDSFSYIVGDTRKQIVSSFSCAVLKTGYIKTIETIIKKNLKRNPNIHAISIGVPASVLNGRIQFINHYEELREFALARHIEEKFKLRTVVERDMNAMMQAIRLKETYAQMRNLGLIIVTADGPGSTALIDGQILKGHRGIAGEIGFFPLYDRANAQEIALSGFRDTDLTDYMARLVACIAVTTNPEKLIIFKTVYAPKDMRKLAAHCERYIEKEMIPILEASDDYHPLYQAGLLELGRALLFETK